MYGYRADVSVKPCEILNVKEGVRETWEERRTRICKEKE